MSQYQPPINTPRQATQAGYRAGQQVQQSGLSDRYLAQLADRQYMDDGVPMTLFSWYKDGFVAGYKQNRQS